MLKPGNEIGTALALAGDPSPVDAVVRARTLLMLALCGQCGPPVLVTTHRSGRHETIRALGIEWRPSADSDVSAAVRLTE